MGAIGAVDIVKRSVGTVRDEAGAYLATVGVLLLVVSAFNLAIDIVLGPTFEEFADPSAPPELGEVLQAAGVGAALGLVGFLLSMAALFFALAVTWDRLEDRPTSLTATWDRHGDRFLPYIGLVVIVLLAAAGVAALGFALFFLVVPPFLGIVGAVYLVLRWYVAPAALVAEDAGILDAMRRSSTLTEGEKLPLLGVLVLLFLVTVLVSVPAGLLVSPYGLSPPQDPAQVAQQATSTGTLVANAVVNYIVQLVTIPLGAAAIVHAYRDLRAAASPGIEEGTVRGPQTPRTEPDEEGEAEPGEETHEVAWDED